LPKEVLIKIVNPSELVIKILFSKDQGSVYGILREKGITMLLKRQTVQVTNNFKAGSKLGNRSQTSKVVFPIFILDSVSSLDVSKQRLTLVLLQGKLLEQKRVLRC
jgi:hypothetical protein